MLFVWNFSSYIFMLLFGLMITSSPYYWIYAKLSDFLHLHSFIQLADSLVFCFLFCFCFFWHGIIELQSV